MPKYTNQTAFDKVLTNLKAQKYRAVIDGDCKFTMIDEFGEEIKCAIGGLLTTKELEDIVKHDRNDCSAVSLIEEGYGKSIERVSTKLIEDLQMCHDNKYNWNLEELNEEEDNVKDGFNQAGFDEMRRIAKGYKLKYHETIKKTAKIAILVLSTLFYCGCSFSLHGGADADLYYSEKSSIGIAGDPYKSRASGISRTYGTEHKMGFSTLKGDK